MIFTYLICTVLLHVVYGQLTKCKLDIMWIQDLTEKFKGDETMLHKAINSSVQTLKKLPFYDINLSFSSYTTRYSEALKSNTICVKNHLPLDAIDQFSIDPLETKKSNVKHSPVQAVLSVVNSTISRRFRDDAQKVVILVTRSAFDPTETETSNFKKGRILKEKSKTGENSEVVKKPHTKKVKNESPAKTSKVTAKRENDENDDNDDKNDNNVNRSLQEMFDKLELNESIETCEITRNYTPKELAEKLLANNIIPIIVSPRYQKPSAVSAADYARGLMNVDLSYVKFITKLSADLRLWSSFKRTSKSFTELPLVIKTSLEKVLMRCHKSKKSVIPTLTPPTRNLKDEVVTMVTRDPIGSEGLLYEMKETTTTEIPVPKQKRVQRSLQESDGIIDFQVTDPYLIKEEAVNLGILPIKSNSLHHRDLQGDKRTIKYSETIPKPVLSSPLTKDDVSLRDLAYGISEAFNPSVYQLNESSTPPLKSATKKIKLPMSSILNGSPQPAKPIDDSTVIMYVHDQKSDQLFQPVRHTQQTDFVVDPSQTPAKFFEPTRTTQISPRPTETPPHASHPRQQQQLQQTAAEVPKETPMNMQQQNNEPVQDTQVPDASTQKKRKPDKHIKYITIASGVAVLLLSTLIFLYYFSTK